MTLSNRQHPMLNLFAEMKPGEFMSLEEAARYDQRPFRSMLIRGYISYRSARGFHITKAGLQAWNLYNSTEIFRKDPTGPLTSYFDPTAYKLKAGAA